MLVINSATEVLDFVDTLYNAIPEGLIDPATACAVHDYKCKFGLIYEHFESIDVAEAIEQFLNNQVEDMIYGILGKKLGKITGQFGITTGLGRGINSGGQADVEGADQSSLIPQLTYDPETGSFGIEWTAVGFSMD
jgi:hypothetical protein